MKKQFLYEHNKEAYSKIKKAYSSGENIAGIVHATGTGKSLIALQLAYDNPDKDFVYVVPSLSIVEHLEENMINLGFKREDFKNIKFRTYQAISNMNKSNTLDKINIDYLVLDEFHHLGAPVWGESVNNLIKCHEDIKIFGMSAYTIRDRNSYFERDMTGEDELFFGKIVSNFTLADAIVNNLLPKPIYRSGYFNLDSLVKHLEDKLINFPIEVESKKELENKLNKIKKTIHKSDDAMEILKMNLKPNGKYIYFCPFKVEENNNDIDSIMSEIKKYLLTFMKEEDICFYKTISADNKLGKNSRDAFYNDLDLKGNNVSDKLQIMFAINQYNEGVHVPNIDGVILGRDTKSDIVYYEQIGRALSVNSKNKDTVIIDLVNNIDFIKDLEDHVRNHKKYQSLFKKYNGTHTNKLEDDVDINISMINFDIYNMLKYVSDRLSINTFEENYKRIVNYFNLHNNSNVPNKFKTFDGINYDENGIDMSVWLRTIRTNYNKLSDDKKLMLEKVKFVLNPNFEKWFSKYNIAKLYYQENNHLNIPVKFKTFDGINYDEKGYAIGSWNSFQRANYDKLSKEQKKLLSEIKFVKSVNKAKFFSKYELLKIYYQENNHSNVPQDFKTIDGINYDNMGEPLGAWITYLRSNYKKLSDEYKKLLEKVAFIPNMHEYEWYQNYKCLEIYFSENGHSNVSIDYVTEDNVNLGIWVSNQRRDYNKLNDKQKELLNKLNFVISMSDEVWNNKFELSKKYYQENGHCNVKNNFKTKDGVNFDDDGEK